MFEVLDLIKPDGPIVEVNMRGLYKNKSSETFPEKWIIKECVHRKIRLTVSSDAHKVEEVNMLLPYSYEILKECGCKELWAIDDKGQFPYNIFKKI